MMNPSQPEPSSGDPASVVFQELLRSVTQGWEACLAQLARTVEEQDAVFADTEHSLRDWLDRADSLTQTLPTASMK